LETGPSEGVEEENTLYDEYEKNAEVRILDVVLQHQVVSDRELKVRLEHDFFPWVVGRVANKLIRDGKIMLVKPPGRKGRMGTPDNFYMDLSVKYEDILRLLLKKRKVSAYVNSLLTRLSPAGFHAEDVFEMAFNSLRFKILGRDVSEFEGRRVSGVEGKEPPNLDFIIEKNNLTYGVDIKNWIKYEFATIPEVMDKVRLAIELDVIPFICARYVDKDTFYKIVRIPGTVYQYRSLILPPEFRDLAHEANALLGYPILADDVLPSYKLDFISKLHDTMLKRVRKRK
jgi:hypothetical protein